MAYALNTKVPIERSQAEIRKILSKYGATAFAFAENENDAVLMFQMCDRRVMFKLPLPIRPAKGSTAISIKTYDQTCRSKWRSLVLSIKAKLETVESGISSFEDEFLSRIILPNGKTVGTTISKQIEHSYLTNEMPPLLGYYE